MNRASRLLLPAILLSMACSRDGADAVAEDVTGDVEDVVERMEPADMPPLAAGLLASDRPWRAAQVMRRYLDETRDSSADHRILAARAEAGWGDWAAAGGLLEGVRGLDAIDDGIGLYLLARARDERGAVAEAIESYRAFLALPPATATEQQRAIARLRLGLAMVRAGQGAAARDQLASAARDIGPAAPWLALIQADALAETGDTAAVRAAVADYDEGVHGLHAWRARIKAARRADDLAGARAIANSARAWAETDGTRAEFLVEAGRAAIEMGDDARGRAALRDAVALNGAGPHGRAAAELLRSGEMSPEDHLAVARVQNAEGLRVESLDGFRRWLDAGIGSASERADVQLEYATALFYADRPREVEDALRPIMSRQDAQFLLARSENQRGETEAAVRIYMQLYNANRRNGSGRQALYLAADARHEEGDLTRARELYRQVIREYPGTEQMGNATMRLAGIEFLEKNYAEAAEIWDDYRGRYRSGTRALQSTYWSGRARLEAGDSAGAAELFRQVMRADRDSYYALLASRRLGVPFWPLPMSSAPAASASAAATVRGWMRGVDLLREAGFPEAASAAVDDVVARAGSDRAVRYALAEALAERGYAQRAIRLGIALETDGPPDLRLLRILYPFPYRRLVTEEARDRGLDPNIAAALIRQESMFEARITSHVGARGLMQIMPATGGTLAEAAGIEGWNAEMLYHPEINVHLGTRYLTQHMEAYDGSLPSVFSAYNAGEHRVERWKSYPEYGDDELFTERIPFAETRDYVRILTRNRAVYEGLHGLEAAAPQRD